MEAMDAYESLSFDWECDELEYRVPNKARLKRERQAYEEAEREDRENEFVRD